MKFAHGVKYGTNITPHYTVGIGGKPDRDDIDIQDAVVIIQLCQTTHQQHP